MEDITITPRMLKIPKAVANEYANKGFLDEEEMESVCWEALGRAMVEWDPKRSPKDDEKSLGGFLVKRCRWAVNTWLTHQRAEIRDCRRATSMNMLRGQEVALCDLITAVEDTLDGVVVGDAEEKAKRCLNEEQWQVLSLRLEGHTLLSIGRELGISRNAVFVIVEKIRRRLKGFRE